MGYPPQQRHGSGRPRQRSPPTPTAVDTPRAAPPTRYAPAGALGACLETVEPRRRSPLRLPVAQRDVRLRTSHAGCLPTPPAPNCAARYTSDCRERWDRRSGSSSLQESLLVTCAGCFRPVFSTLLLEPFSRPCSKTDPAAGAGVEATPAAYGPAWWSSALRGTPALLPQPRIRGSSNTCSNQIER